MIYKNPVQFLDQNDVPYGIKHVGNKPRVSAMPYLYDIAEGNVANHDVFRILGYNGDVGATAEDLWEVGGAYVFPTAGMGMEVVSSSVEDDPDKGGAVPGTGVHSVMIHYLDTSYAEQTETVATNGAGVMPTTATDILRINHFHAVTVGTGGVAAGNVDLRHLADTPIYSRIGAGSNSAATGVWTVPAAKTAYIVCWGVGTAGGNKDARFFLRTTSSLEGVLTAGVFQEKDIAILEDAGLIIPVNLPIAVPAQADMKLSVISAAASAKCTGHVEGWYES